MEPQDHYNITINDKSIQVAEIIDLLNQNKRKEALNYVIYHTGINEYDANTLVSNLESDRDFYLNNPVRTSTEDRVVVRKENDSVVATIYKADGTERTVRNTDSNWVEVEEMIGHNDYLTDLGVIPKQYTNWALKEDKKIAEDANLIASNHSHNDVVEYNISHNTRSSDAELLTFHNETKRVYAVITALSLLVIISFVIFILWQANNYTY